MQAVVDLDTSDGDQCPKSSPDFVLQVAIQQDSMGLGNDGPKISPIRLPKPARKPFPTESVELQVAERSEYLSPSARLMDYEYVHECYKYDRDVVFIVVTRGRMQRPYLRTVSD